MLLFVEHERDLIATTVTRRLTDKRYDVVFTESCRRRRCPRWRKCPNGYVRDRKGCRTCRCRGELVDSSLLYTHCTWTPPVTPSFYWHCCDREYSHSFIHSFILSFFLSFIHSFFCSFIHSFSISFLPSFFHSFILSFFLHFIHSFLLSFILSFFIHSFIHSFILSIFLCSFIHSLNVLISLNRPLPSI